MSLRSHQAAPVQNPPSPAPGTQEPRALEPRPLELLAPARNREFGIAAIDHGADAVYIGGPGFGARAAAGNSLSDIETLVQHAHRFGAHVYVALNTILRDVELEDARRLAWQAWEAGADALIIQDMGLLEVDLPPIALHASTQVDNRSVEKVRFLEQVGFSQVVLARELSLAQIAKIAPQTRVNLEFFIHGALCVSYSGQCYISHAHTGRSANRGECSQACRLPYSLADGDGTLIAEDKHLLSLKDNDQRDNLRELIAAGITSFKIEGRLKDLAYVKNVTAFYRQRLDALLDELPGYRRASDGRCTYSFVPQPEKTFNRGATDYFVRERQIDIAATDTPKFAGEPAGEVLRVGREHLDVGATPVFHNGDGLAFFDAHGELTGLRVNRVEPLADVQRLHLAERCDAPGLNLKPGTPLFRNHDHAFLRGLDKPSAERRIDVALRFGETADGFALAARDARGTAVEVRATHVKEPARQPERVLPTIREQLGKLGGTIFSASTIEVDLSGMWFLPASLLNGLRRDALAALEAARLKGHVRPAPAPRAAEPPLYPERELSYLGNVFNAKARAFYTRHGVELIADAYEANTEKGAVSLMITKHCLRYSYNLCPKQVKGIRPDPMTLVRGNDKLTLRFDCKRCEMHVIGKLRKSMPVTLVPVGAKETLRGAEQPLKSR